MTAVFVKTVAVGILLAFTLAGTASFPADKVELGCHLGGSMASLERGEQEYDHVSAISFGLRAHKRMSRFLDYGFELNFVRKGAETDLCSVDSKTDLTWVRATLTADYIEVPFLLRAGLPLSSWVKPAVCSGLYVAWNLAESVTFEREVASPLEGFEVAGSDFGFVAGAALGLVVKGRKVSLELRYTRGMKKSIDRSTGDRLINGVWTALIGLTP
jgi:hypothetical protein